MPNTREHGLRVGVIATCEYSLLMLVLRCKILIAVHGIDTKTPALLCRTEFCGRCLQDTKEIMCPQSTTLCGACAAEPEYAHVLLRCVRLCHDSPFTRIPTRGCIRASGRRGCVFETNIYLVPAHVHCQYASLEASTPVELNGLLRSYQVAAGGTAVLMVRNKWTAADALTNVATVQDFLNSSAVGTTMAVSSRCYVCGTYSSSMLLCGPGAHDMLGELCAVLCPCV